MSTINPVSDQTITLIQQHNRIIDGVVMTALPASTLFRNEAKRFERTAQKMCEAADLAKLLRFPDYFDSVTAKNSALSCRGIMNLTVTNLTQQKELVEAKIIEVQSKARGLANVVDKKHRKAIQKISEESQRDLSKALDAIAHSLRAAQTILLKAEAVLKALDAIFSDTATPLQPLAERAAGLRSWEPV